MTSSEQSLRESLLSAFRYFEPQGRSVVHAADFQQALASVGLSFGTEFVDRVMLQCKIDAEGYVDFSEFASTVTNARSGRPAPAAHGSASEPRGAHSTAAAPPAPEHVPEDMPQSERVRRFAPQLHAAFKELDAGDISVAEFSDRLHALGIHDTSESRRVLRQNPLSFRALVHALLTSEDPDKPVPAGQRSAGDKGADIIAHRRRRPDSATMHAGMDVVTWRGDAAEAAALSPKRFVRAPASAHAGDAGRRRMLATDSSGVADSLHFDSADAAHAGGAVEPATDLGVLREQVFSSVRQLDQGRISPGDFRRRMLQLNVPVTPDVERLLRNHESHGTANFKAFVHAFDEYFHQRAAAATMAAAISAAAPADPARTQRVPAPAAGPPASPARARARAPYSTQEDEEAAAPARRYGAAGPPSAAGLARLAGGEGETGRPEPHSRRSMVPTAVRTHGDIISWSHGGQVAEAASDGSALGRESLQRKVALQRSSSQLLAWEEASAGQAPAQGRAHVRQDVGSAQRSSGDIIAWGGADAAHGRTPEVGSRSVRRQPSAADMQAHRLVRPFGTEEDEGAGAPRDGEARGGHSSRSHFPQRITGEWFGAPANAAAAEPYHRPPAPFGTDE